MAAGFGLVQIPTHALTIGFAALFAVVVGPVGWWYAVKRKGKPLLYFALAPALSLCVIVLPPVVVCS